MVPFWNEWGRKLLKPSKCPCIFPALERDIVQDMLLEKDAQISTCSQMVPGNRGILAQIGYVEIGTRFIW